MEKNKGTYSVLILYTHAPRRPRSRLHLLTLISVLPVHDVRSQHCGTEGVRGTQDNIPIAVF